MKNWMIGLAIVALAGPTIFVALDRAHDSFTNYADGRGALMPVTEENIERLSLVGTGTSDRDAFERPTLDELVAFDPAGYEALPTNDRGALHRWIHMTQHAMFRSNMGYYYECDLPERHTK